MSTTQLKDYLSGADSERLRVRDAQLGLVDSHKLVELDDSGEPEFERFVFVDEVTCTGCTNW